jgi:ComF family protein
MVFRLFRELLLPRDTGQSSTRTSPNTAKDFLNPQPDALWRWLPSRCAICRSWPENPLCDTCISRFAAPVQRCRTCALPLNTGPDNTLTPCGACLKNPPPLDACLCATPYAWPWIDLITQLKFHQQPGWAGPLATLLGSVPGADDVIEEADWLLPIPLSAERLSERGYNQSLLLARQLHSGKTDAHLLLRTRHTPAQRTLPRTERLANLVGAFAVDPLRSHQVQGRRIVLIDDVMTSGASLHTAARELRRAGATHISAIVLARTEAATEQAMEPPPATPR